MSTELKHAILVGCLRQVTLALPTEQYDVEADFRMARLDMDGDNKPELFKLELKHGITRRIE